MKTVLAVVGPTGVGKTALAVELAWNMGGEIVGADSRQVYRGLDIGTAWPTPEERRGVPHHLIDVADPDEEFGLARYLDLAKEAVAAIHGRDRPALVVGGTGQYVWALLEGWSVPRVAPDWGLRTRLRERARREGSSVLHRELAEADPAVAARMDPRNVRRVVRALEVLQTTRRPFSRQRTKAPPDWETSILGLTMPRADLYRRIDERVDGMVAAGWVSEVWGLLERGYGPELPSLQSVGYREIVGHLLGGLPLAEAVQKAKYASHRLARRQYAWFRQTDERIRWVEGGGDTATLAETVDTNLSI